MRTASHYRFSAITYLLLAIGFQFMFGCARASWFIGVGGKYNEAKIEFQRGRFANIDKVIDLLEALVREDPTYRDSLTLLGMAYYRKGRNHDAFQILHRALAVNPEDEIAWLVLGLTQFRLGDNEKGLKAVQGGLTLLIKASQDGYRGYEHEYWDRNNAVKKVIRKAVFAARKGLDERKNLIRAVENVFLAIDDEEFLQRIERPSERETDIE